jgi:hypothetical protein
MLDKTAHHHLERLKTATTGRVSRSELAKWVCSNTSLNGKPYNLKTHWYQEELLNDPSSDICVVKPAQIGASELSLRWALALVMTTPDVMRCGYTFPTYTAATNFARTRFANIIEGCPAAKAAMNTADIDTVDLKTFGENREIHFRGAAVGNAAISTTLDVLYHDELAFSDPEIIATYTSRTQASKYKWRIVFSTPTWPGDSITTEMANSRRKMLMCKCNHCNHTFLPNYWRDVKIPGYDKDLSEITKDNLHRIRWQEANLLCPSCGRVPNLEREHRTWVVENPTENHVSSGYKLSPFDVPAIVTPVNLIKGYTSYGSKTLFQQFALGEPAQDAENGLTEEDLEKMGVQLAESPFTQHFIGMDVGVWCHIVVGGMTYDGHLGIVHMERVHLTNVRERMAKLTAEYRVVLHLVDQQPMVDLVMALTDEYPNLYAAMFVTRQGLELFEVKLREENLEKAQLNVRQVQISRNAVLDKLLAECREGKLWIRKTGEWETVKAHLQDLKRASTTLRNGEFSSTWMKSSKGQDHYHMAILYLYVAAQMRGLVTNSTVGMSLAPQKFRIKSA